MCERLWKFVCELYRKFMTEERQKIQNDSITRIWKKIWITIECQFSNWLDSLGKVEPLTT